VSFEEWEEVRLKKISKVVGGYAFKSKDFKDDGIPLIKIKNLKNYNISLDSLNYIDPSFLKLDSKYHIQYRDILIAMTGSHITLPDSAVGRVVQSRYNSRNHQLIVLSVSIGHRQQQEKVPFQLGYSLIPKELELLLVFQLLSPEKLN